MTSNHRQSWMLSSKVSVRTPLFYRSYDKDNLLGRLKDQEPCYRAVVFSQFTSFLDLIQAALEREQIEQYRFDGTMDVKKKNAVISEFKSHSRGPKILVVSLKAGGVGLNVSLLSVTTRIWLNWHILVDQRKPCVHGISYCCFYCCFYFISHSL